MVLGSSPVAVTSAYCLLVGKVGTQYCKFHYPFDESPVTCTKYNKGSNITGVSFKSEIVAKRNDP